MTFSHVSMDIGSRDALVDISPQAARISAVMEAIMIALLAFMPLALGVVAAWSEQLVIGAAFVLTMLLVVRLFVAPNIKFVWTWAYLPVALFALVAAMQLIPLPVEMVQAVSPGTAEMKTRLLEGLGGTDSMTLSFYPQATRHDLRLVLAIAAIFVVTVNLYRSPRQIKRLLGGIAAVGGGVALLSLAQVVSGTNAIFWTIDVGHKADSGTFVNHSNFSQFMNLSIGAALGYVLMRLHEEFQGKRATLSRVAARLGDVSMRTVWAASGVVVIGTAAIFLSMSRGGVISMLIAAGFTVVMLSLKKGLRGRGWVIAMMALLSFVVVLYIGFDAAYDRLATLSEEQAEGGRMQIVKDIASAWTRFPVFGVGLGTHEVVYPMFDRSTFSSLAAHAENEYAQAGEETGAAGLLALLVFAVMVWRSYARSALCLSVPARSAVFGLGFGLMAIMIHSLSDFGQHLPANAALTATFCALLITIYRMGASQPRHAESSKARGRISRSIGIAISVVLLGSLLVSLGDIENCRQAEAHWDDAMSVESKLREIDWLGTNAEYTAIISSAENAVDYAPGDVKYRHWLSVYRWRSISRVADPNGKIVLPPRGQEFAQRIVDEMAGTRQLCPTFGATCSVMGQLEWYVLGKEDGKRQMRMGYELAPCDPVAGMIAADLAIQEGNIQDACAKLRKVVEISGAYFAGAARSLISGAKRPDMAMELAGDDHSRLFELEKLLRNTTGNEALVEKVRQRAVELIKARADAPDAGAGELASVAGIYVYEKDTDAAIEYYRRALNLDYGQVGWRLRRARLLADADRVKDAIHEARICLRLRPQMAAARKLIEDLSVLDKGTRR